MKYVITQISLIIILFADLHSSAIYRNRNFNGRLNHDSTSFRYLYITQPIISHKKHFNIDNEFIRSRKGVHKHPILRALNPENAELHPESLSGVEQKISQEELEKLKKRGLLDGDAKSWRNWHIVTQGEWDDVGVKMLPEARKNLKITEPYALRKPLKYWGFLRGTDNNISSYPIVEEYYRDTYGKIDVCEHGGNNPLYNPLLFQRFYGMNKDRWGMGYHTPQPILGFAGLPPDAPTNVKEASDIIRIPDSGRLYQKFYMGPYPETMGWTIGSLLKVMTLSRCPGHAVVAVKIHNMEKDTTVPGVADDLLNIALNFKSVALQTLEPGREARIRTVIKGPAMLCAGGLEWPAFVKVANPEQYITRIDEGAELDLEIKVEWGRGFWIADNKGLYRMEEGADSLIHKRRNIKEVDEEGFYPTSCVFGGCRMIRLAVHKLLGQRWCALTHTCPDPKDQLVVEIWTDVSTTPRDVLEYGLTEVIAWLVELKRQISHDVDFENEDEQLKDTWEKIDKYGSLKRRQQLMGGPPVIPLHETNIIPNLKESDCQYAEPGDHTKIPQAPFSLPNNLPDRPGLDALQWLAEQLQSEEYSDKSEITAEKFEKFIPRPVEDVFENKDIELLPVNTQMISSLRMSGFNTMADIMDFTVEELSHFPSLTVEAAKAIKNFLNENKTPNV